MKARKHIDPDPEQIAIWEKEEATMLAFHLGALVTCRALLKTITRAPKLKPQIQRLADAIEWQLMEEV